MHISHKFKTSYKISDNGVDKVLEDFSDERDLGVFVTSDLKPSIQCVKAAYKAVGSKDDQKKLSKDRQRWLQYTLHKNSSGDEIANVNVYAVRPEATRVRWNNAK